MGKYSQFNIIPIGDHCAISLALKELNLRQHSYPFDWVTNVEQLYDTNIIYNASLIHELETSDNVDDIVNKYIGNAFDIEKINNEKVNTLNNILFPHDIGNVNDIFEKYKRRFIRLKSDLNNKNIFVLLTRHYYIEEHVFQTIRKQLLNSNCESIILFISGTNHNYFEKMKDDNVIFKYIEYDISKFYDYDYISFRPNVKNFLSEFLS